MVQVRWPPGAFCLAAWGSLGGLSCDASAMRKVLRMSGGQLAEGCAETDKTAWTTRLRPERCRLRGFGPKLGCPGVASRPRDCRFARPKLRRLHHFGPKPCLPFRFVGFSTALHELAAQKHTSKVAQSSVR